MSKHRINIEQLRKRCQQSIPNIMLDLGGIIEGNNHDQYAYKDNDSRVLCVAHTDTVQSKFHFKMVRDRVYCPTLDDRLGVYTVMDLLPEIGINMDILLTENEESFLSTASFFRTEKNYNWIVEFDRRGDDVVTYDYAWENYLKDYFNIGLGTYSDIVDLQHLDCKGLNVGVGYEDEHSLYAYFSMADYVSQINKFIKFYQESKDIYFPHTQIISTTKRDTCYEPWEDDPAYTGSIIDTTDMIRCPSCGTWFTEDTTIVMLNGWLCPNCSTLVTPQDQPIEPRKYKGSRRKDKKRRGKKGKSYAF